MASLNRVQLIGHLGRDAELRFTAGGTAVLNFSLATTETWKDKAGAKQERTDWHRCQLWGPRAESVSQYLTKGKLIMVEGSISYSKYNDKQGVERMSTDIRTSNVILLGGGTPRADQGGGGSSSAPPDDHHSEPLTDDDIPF